MKEKIVVKLYEDLIRQTSKDTLHWDSGSYGGEFCTRIKGQTIRVSFNIGYGRSIRIGGLEIFPSKTTFPLHYRLEEEVLSQAKRRKFTTESEAENFLTNYVNSL
jgi:hypothetical protein